MSLVGAFKCRDGAVLFADGQETLRDYAEFAVDKIYSAFFGWGRVLMTADGESYPIEMLWGEVAGQIKNSGESKSPALKSLIIRSVAKVTKKCFMPCPRDCRPNVDAIWVIQQAEPGLDSITMFRTQGLLVNSVDPYCFGGSPQIIIHYLSDLYLKDVPPLGVDEAEALAAFMLWEAKTYDPYCGKQSDIITLTLDGEIRWVFPQQTTYWEEHFALYKKSQRFMPLLTCAGPRLQGLYQEQLEHFVQTVRFLAREQKKMRLCGGAFHASLEGKLINRLARKKDTRPSASRKSKG
jgi:hypothetical protein